MDKYTRVLLAILILVLFAIGLNIYTIKVLKDTAKVTSLQQTTPQVIATDKPISTENANVVVNENDITADLTIIKAEIRALREVLGLTTTFEEFSNLVKNLKQE